MQKHAAILLLGAASIFGADYAAEGKLWWSHIQFLADDKLEGRSTGSEGFRQAVAYVAGRFDKIGLKPAGTSGYLQPVRFLTRELAAAESGLWLVRDGKEEPLAPGQEATLTGRGEMEGTLEAPMVFLGYGISIPEVHHDELAGLDLKGKIAVYVNTAGPVEASANLKAHYGSAVERWAALKKAGAIGVAVIQNPRVPNPNPADQSAPKGGRGAAGAAGRGPQAAFVLADPELQEAAGQKVSVMIARRGAGKFFAGSGHTYEEIEELAQENRPLPRFPLACKLRAKAVFKKDSVEAPNVVGMIPGSDPKLKDEYVVLSAHLDHLGVGRAVNGDSINNGAMDDASGVASVLEIARLMKESAMQPKRSVLFLMVAAEEKGELGSRYFAAHPTVPAGAIVADINLDMFLPLYPLKVIEVQGLVESTLGDEVRAAAKGLGVEVQEDREPEQNRFIRSDQYSFIRQGIPALAFKFGYEYGSPEEKTRREWVRTIYHKPADDLNQPVDQAAAALFDRVILSLLDRVAGDPARPRWKNDSFFRRFAK